LATDLSLQQDKSSANAIVFIKKVSALNTTINKQARYPTINQFFISKF
jgi:hypothetical protein